MYEALDKEKYSSMNPEERIGELRKWLTEQLDNHKSVLRSIAGTMPEVDEDLDTVMSVDLRDLPTMINNYEENSTAYIVLKYRLENSIEDCDDGLLDCDILGKVVMEILPDCDSEEDVRTILAHRSFADDMITICQIFCLDDLKESFTIWRP